MKKFSNQLSLFTAMALFFVLYSCKKEDSAPKCKTCSATIVSYIDGDVFATQNVSGTQYCDQTLSQIESNPVVTITQSVGGITQKVVTTYTCK